MISILIPFFNEEKNLPILYQEIKKNLEGADFEIVFVNDGSTDKSIDELKKATKSDPHVKIINHRKKSGKGKALTTGFSHSKGDIIIFMDADLQDDPADLPRFIEKMNQGYDLVNGWREKRNDGLVKTLPSRIGNLLILKTFLQSKFHDINCGYKAMRREILEEVPLYGDNFRFLPVMAEKNGFKTTELVVHHNSRKYGVSKFGFFRRFTVFADILTAYFIFRFSEKPLHFFGAIGGGFFFTGFIISLYLSYERLFFGVLLYRRPALWLGILFIIIGIQIIMTGIIAELVVYLYKLQQHRNSKL